MTSKKFEDVAGEGVKQDTARNKTYRDLYFVELVQHPDEEGFFAVSYISKGIVGEARFRSESYQFDTKLDTVLKDLETQGMELIPSKSADPSDERTYYLNPLKFKLVSGDNGVALVENEQNDEVRIPYSDDLKTKLTEDDLDKKWPELIKKDEPALQWEAGGRIYDTKLSEVVAVRLFETKEGRMRDSQWMGDSVFMYPDSNKDGTLVSDAETRSVSFGLQASVEFNAVKKLFEDAGINLIQMTDQKGNEIFVNEAFEHTVKAQLANEDTGPVFS